MKKLLFLFVLLGGCASLPFKITGWKDGREENKVTFSNGQTANIVGNPLMTCYSKFGFQIASGYFVTINDTGYLILDEFGKRYVWIGNDRDEGNYCYLGDEK